VIYNKLDELFINLPIATIINLSNKKKKLFVVHGGINDKIDLKRIQKLDRTLFTSVCQPCRLEKRMDEYKHFGDIVDMLWSDPQVLKGIQFNHVRRIGKLFGSSITKKFLKTNKLTMLIRSHECKKHGHELSHNGRLLTIFSASNYNNKNDGAVLLVSAKKDKLEVLTYNSKPQKVEQKKEDSLANAVKQLRLLLFKSKDKIMKDCGDIDKTKTGYIKINELFHILNKYVNDIPYYEIKDRLCECDQTINIVKYDSLFQNIQVKSKFNMPDSIKKNFEMLATIFNMLDSDNNGYITPDEFSKACRIIFDNLGTTFTQNEINDFIKVMDLNKDGKIDLEEFASAFTVALTN
jgi:serine/threonine-protein phosphatase with EF-hands